VDQEIKLAEPHFITLGNEEAAQAVRILAVLIKAANARPAASTFSRPGVSPSSGELADGRSIGDITARRGRPIPQVVGGERAPGARPTVLRTVPFLLAVPRTFGGACES
jgi:hypothetical protein